MTKEDIISTIFAGFVVFFSLLISDQLYSEGSPPFEVLLVDDESSNRMSIVLLVNEPVLVRCNFNKAHNTLYSTLYEAEREGLHKLSIRTPKRSDLTDIKCYSVQHEGYLKLSEQRTYI